MSTFILTIIAVTVIGLFVSIGHELGHAIPALIYSKKNVTIYVGSRENPKEAINFTIGRLKVHLTFNPNFWSSGRCVFDSTEVTNSQMKVILLMGPLGSLLCGITFCFIVFIFNLNDYLKLAGLAYLGASIIDFVVNIYPKSEPDFLDTGSVVYGDGAQLLHLIRHDIGPDLEKKAIKHFEKGEYDESLKACQKFIDKKVIYPGIYGLALYCHFHRKEYQEVLNVFDELNDVKDIGAHNFQLAISSLKSLKEMDNALVLFNQAVAEYPTDASLINNRGYFYLEAEKYYEAKSDFDWAIKVDSDFAFAYNNRGYCLLKIDRLEEGLTDIQRSLDLDEENSYAHRNLGIYHLKKRNFQLARTSFTRALELDPETPLVEDYLNQTLR